MTGEGERMVEVVQVTAERWGDLEALFGPHGASGGCWCMYWRRTAGEYKAGKGEGNRAALQELVAAGAEPGLLAYVDGQPAGWVSLGPREQFPRFQRSRNLKPVDDEPVWSVVCFFVGKGFRRMGLQGTLLRAAVDYARAHGARIVEGYPVEPAGTSSDNYEWTGFVEVFREAGFEEVARRTERRPVMRKSEL
jgi:GNAT superfamily N-acetyltransferase